MQANFLIKRFISLLTLFAVFVTVLSGLSPVFANEPDGALQDSTAAAKSWLAIMDQKQYETSYEACSSVLHQSVTLARWTGALQAIRENFGNVESRELVRHDYFPEGFNGSPGQYMNLEFSTKFTALRVNYSEVVMLRREGGTWLTVGYRLNPPPASPEQLASQPQVQEDTPQQVEMNSPGSKPVSVNQPKGGNAQAGVPIEATSQPLPR